MNLKLDGISTSEHIDSSGELLIIENHDISDLVEGKGVLNFEHSNKAEDIVGAVIYAKKIMKKEDCENDRQRKYWEFSKKPFVYIIGELWEDEEHPGACAVAAMVRYYNKKSEKILVGFSIEGATLERDDYILKESVGRRVAITLRSCNKMAIAGVLDDPREKSVAKSIKKMEHSLAKSFGIESCILEDMFMPKDPILDLHKAVESLAKTMEAGMYNVAPSQLTGQAALTREHISGFDRNRVKAAVRDWDRKRPLKEVLKSALPEVSDDYIGHFEKLAEELALKKNMPSNKLIRVGAKHSSNQHQNDEQKKLIEGLYFDPHKPSKEFSPGHDQYTNALHKLKNDSGQNVLVKNPRSGAGVDDEVSTDRPHDNAEAATHYYNLASDVFGMGKNVPVTNYFQHAQIKPVGEGIPKGADWGSGKNHQVQEIQKGSKTLMLADSRDVSKAHGFNKKTGDSHKLAMMDAILGNIDRHSGNLLIHPKGHIVNVDNDLAFTHGVGQTLPDYIHSGDEQIHADAADWIKTIDPKVLAGKMLDQGHAPATIKGSIAALKTFQNFANKPGTSIGQSHAHAVSAATNAMLQHKHQHAKKAV